VTAVARLADRLREKVAAEQCAGRTAPGAAARVVWRSLRWRGTLVGQRRDRSAAYRRLRLAAYRSRSRGGRGSATTYATLGQLHRDLGDVDAAYRAWTRAAELDPLAPHVYAQHAYELWQRGWWDEALDLWQRRVEAQRELARREGLDRLPFRILDRDWTGVIGMIACLDTYVKQQLLDGGPLTETIVLGHPLNISNPSLVDYWREHLPTMILGREAYSRFVPLAQLLGMSLFVWPDSDGALRSYFDIGGSVQRRWEAERRGPLLTLTHEHRERGRAELARVGVPEDAWFVTLHVREAGYHDLRNADIATYDRAIAAVAERGGWVIRMGDPSMSRLAAHPRVVDYAHSDAKSDWMDVFLWADCRFMIGTQSGPFQVPGAFGVPVVQTNWCPAATRYWFSDDLVIPKLYRHEGEGRLLRHSEWVAPPVGFCHLSDYLASRGIRAVDNTPEELELIVVEMLDRLDGTLTYTDEDETLRRRFDSVEPPVRYRVPGGGARPGRDFLRARAELLDGPG
jgi:putative glycosyltransferase (TIGR04372 family)